MPAQLRFRRGTFVDKSANPLLYGEPYFNSDIQTVQIGGSFSDITLVAFPYSGSGIITGSFQITGSFTSSLQLGYTWVGGAGNKSVLVATSSFFAVSGSSAHTILNSGSLMPQRSKLDFIRFTVTDDLPNDQTIVTRPPSVVVSGSAPANPIEGDEWIDINTWKKYMWYLNGVNTDYWVEVGLVVPNESGSVGNSGFPFSGSAVITGSLSVSNAISASVMTSSLFIGNGAGLFNISQSAIVGLNLSKITTGSISASVNINGDVYRLDSGSTTIMYVTSSTNNLAVGGKFNPLEKVHITGSLYVSSNVTASAMLITGSGVNELIVGGSGSSAPIFTVNGSQGQLFSVTDQLSGSLWKVTDISGLPIIQAFSDSTILLGSNQSPALFTTVKIAAVSGSTNIYLIPTGSYDAAYFDYKIASSSNARAGQITAANVSGNVVYTETSTIDIGDTRGVKLTVTISGSYMAFTGSFVNNGWAVKTIVRAI
jgi:hypothetical protein